MTLLIGRNTGEVLSITADKKCTIGDSVVYRNKIHKIRDMYIADASSAKDYIVFHRILSETQQKKDFYNHLFDVCDKVLLKLREFDNSFFFTSLILSEIDKSLYKVLIGHDGFSIESCKKGEFLICGSGFDYALSLLHYGISDEETIRVVGEVCTTVGGACDKIEIKI